MQFVDRYPVLCCNLLIGIGMFLEHKKVVFFFFLSSITGGAFETETTKRGSVGFKAKPTCVRPRRAHVPHQRHGVGAPRWGRVACPWPSLMQLAVVCLRNPVPCLRSN